MKTTIELPDAIVKRAKLYCVEHGVTMKTLMSEALTEKINSASQPANWEFLFGAFAKGENKKESQRIEKKIKEEFNQVDPEEWN